MTPNLIVTVTNVQVMLMERDLTFQRYIAGGVGPSVACKLMLEYFLMMRVQVMRHAARI